MFALILRRRPNGLWQLTALYKDRRGQTVVSGSWHREREHAMPDVRASLA
jgi:hypothetical protein